MAWFIRRIFHGPAAAATQGEDPPSAVTAHEKAPPQPPQPYELDHPAVQNADVRDAEHQAEVAGDVPLRTSRPARTIALVVAAWTLYQAVYWLRLARTESQNPQDGSYDILGYGIAPLFAIATVACLWFAMRRT